jgi:hypothetical protein
MKEIFENTGLYNIISIGLGIISTIIVLTLFNRKRNADRKLVELFKSDKNFDKKYNVKIQQLKAKNNSDINEFKKRIDINSNYDLKSIEIKRKMLEQEIELLKLELLKQEIEHLIYSLNPNDKREILKAINQKNLIGQKNYINNILRQSGSTENISFELEK